jgi:hypothetical protein
MFMLRVALYTNKRIFDTNKNKNIKQDCHKTLDRCKTIWYTNIKLLVCHIFFIVFVTKYLTDVKWYGIMIILNKKKIL